MPETLFIADLHLAPTRPQTISFFLDFLQKRATQAECLYLLGDIFEAWLGDDEDEPAYQQILQSLKKTTQYLPIYILHGNRDFLLGQQFEQITGCQLLPETSVIDLYGTSTLIMHGDSLCTRDVAYQQFRQQVRHPQWQQQFLAQSLTQRREIAKQARAQSQTHTQTVAMDIVDVTQEEVDKVLTEKQVDHLIHGHTHRPAKHEWQNEGKKKHRYVVGDWQDKSAIILSCTPHNWQLIDLKKLLFSHK